MNKKNVTKTQTIKFRVDKEFKKQLNHMCLKHQLNMSEYIDRKSVV